MHRIALFLTFAVMTLGASFAHGAERLFVKPGVTTGSLAADEEACRLIAEPAKAPPQPEFPKIYPHSNGVLGHAITELMVQRALDAQARRGAFARCMKERSYVLAKFSAVDAKDYSRLTPTSRVQWLDKFFQSDRLQAAVAPPLQIVPPLPEGVADPRNHGPFQIIPGTLEARPGHSATEGEALFSVKGKFLGIATLKEAIYIPDGKGTVPAGQIFYLATASIMLEGAALNSWCTLAPDQMKQKNLSTICIANESGYYVLFSKNFPNTDISPDYKTSPLKKYKITTPILLEKMDDPPEITVDFVVAKKFVPPVFGTATYEGITLHAPAKFSISEYFRYFSADIGTDRVYFESDPKQKGTWYTITKVDGNILPIEPMDYW